MTGILNILAGSISSAIKDGYFNLVSLLLPGNGTNGAQNNTFLDSSSNNFTITRNGNTTQGTFSPFSQTGWSNYFNGSNDSFSITSTSALSFGTGDFTIEFWIYRTGSNEDIVFEGRSTEPQVVPHVQINPSGYALFYVNGAARITGTTVLATNTWHHVAVARSGTSTKLFVNGTQEGGTYTDSNSYTIASTVYIGRDYLGSAGAYVQGYLSNLRVIKGSAVYTSAFTPSTTPLTAISGTSLLTCQSNRFVDNSSNAFAITVNGTPSVQAFSPFAPTAAYSAATNGGSGYFDGTGDYVTWPSGSSVAFGTGDFTVETWFYLKTTPAGALYFIDARDASNTNAWAFHIASSTSIIWYNGSAQFIVTVTMPINQWNHIAYVRSGTTGALYLNGTRVNTQTDSTNYTVQPGTSYVASRYNAIEQFPGYLSGTRIVKGTAAYSGTTYTVPTAPPTAITNTQLLLNFTNAGITDATGKNVLETVGNAQISTTQSKFGGSSMYFDGTGDLLFSPASQNYSFPGDFTIEGWMNTSTTSTEGGAYRRIFATGPDNAASLQLVMSDGSTASGSISVVTSTFVISGNINAATGSWVHFAIARSGTSMKLFINGVQSGSTATTSQAFTNGATYGIYVGSSQGGTGRYLGYLQDIRITKGYTRYTANFTPPAAAFPVQ